MLLLWNAKDSLCLPQTIQDFQNILQQGKSQTGSGADMTAGEPIVTDPVIPSSSSSLPIGKVAALVIGLLLVGGIGWYAKNHFGDKGKSSEVAQQDVKTDSVSQDTVRIAKFTAKENVESPKGIIRKLKSNLPRPLVRWLNL